TGEPALAHIIEGFDRGGERNARIWPVDEQEVDIVEPHELQAALGRALQIGRRQIRPPNLRGKEDFLARNPRSPDRLTHLPLIFVSGRRVHMAVADLERMSD